ncbi:MAG: TIM44-like domain-containing protein, partial [Usitatibacter sp.]
MKKSSILLLAAALTVGIASFDADAARRFGGGNNLGKQRETPAMKQAPSAAPAAPVKAAPSPSAPVTPVAPAPKPSFMSRWGGMIAGLGIGALLGSMFSGGLGGGIGMVLMFLALGAIAFMVIRMLAARGKPLDKPVEFAGVGNDAPPAPRVAIGANLGGAAQADAVSAPSNIPPDFQVEPFLRQAKLAFIRLQAANDAKDLDDIRDYTTPEMYAEIAM